MLQRLFFPGIFICYLWAFFCLDRWPDGHLRADALGYYLYLPATFIYGDHGNYDASLKAWRQYNHADPDPREDEYGMRLQANGKRMIKYTPGLALLESPFFFAAHVWCKATGGAADGFSMPYVLCIGLSSLFFACLGLYILYSAVLVYFPKNIARITVLVLAFASNLFYFSTINVGMAHPAMFFLLAALIRVSIRFRTKTSKSTAFQVGVLLGLIALTRLNVLIFGLVPLLWGLGAWKSGNVKRLSTSILAWIPAALAFGMMLLPQLLYWKYASGHWFTYSYGPEKFHWGHPEIIKGMFSFQNGWLVYTPVMLLVFPGIFLLKKWAKDAFWPVVAVLPIHIYVIYSWWCWQYINGFGSRPMVDLYPLLAFPLTAFFAWALSHKFLSYTTTLLLLGLSLLNLHQSWQCAQSLIVTENNHEAFYWQMLGQNRLSREAFVAYETKEVQPRRALTQLDTLLFQNMEDSSATTRVQEPRHSGNWACACAEEFSCSIKSEIRDTHYGKWLKASLWAYTKAADYERNITKVARLVVDFQDASGKSIQYRSITIPSKIANPENIMWSGGKADTWGEAWLCTRIPRDAKTVSAYVWSPNGQKITVDDFMLMVGD